MPTPSRRKSTKNTASRPIDIEKLERTLRASADLAKKIREEAAQAPSIPTKRRRSAVARMQKHTQKLSAQLTQIQKLGELVAVHQTHVEMMAKQRHQTQRENEQLSMIDREESRMSELAKSAENQTDYGQASLKELQTRLPGSQRRLRRLTQGPTSLRVRGKADQVADHLETKVFAIAEEPHERLDMPALKR